jgi:hypothetical protein
MLVIFSPGCFYSQNALAYCVLQKKVLQQRKVDADCIWQQVFKKASKSIPPPSFLFSLKIFRFKHQIIAGCTYYIYLQVFL